MIYTNSKKIEKPALVRNLVSVFDQLKEIALEIHAQAEKDEDLQKAKELR